MRHKPKQNKSNKPITKVFLYTSVCCNLNAEKPACVKVSKKEAETQGLGSWRCTGCGKSCVCKRVNMPRPETANAS